MKQYIYTNNIIKIFNSENEEFKVEINSQRLFIRSFNNSEKDKQLVFNIFKNAEATKLFSYGGPFDDDFINEKINRWSTCLNNRDPFMGLLVFKKIGGDGCSANGASESEVFIGHCILGPGREGEGGESRFAILMLGEYWGNGYGSEIAQCLIDDYSTALHSEGYSVNGQLIKSVFATARVDNFRSNSVLTKVGMKSFNLESLFGADRYLYIKHININK